MRVKENKEEDLPEAENLTNKLSSKEDLDCSINAAYNNNRDKMMSKVSMKSQK